MLIGLTGLPGSGKDHCCERFAALATKPVERLALADKLKQSAAALLDIDVEIMEECKRGGDGHIAVLGKPMSMRLFLQQYGTEAHRDIFGWDFWVDASLPMHYRHEGRIVVVTDVRFDNEAQRIRDLGGLCYLVSAASHTTHSGHSSDDGVSPRFLNGVIDNDHRDDPEYLDRQLLEVIR